MKFERTKNAARNILFGTMAKLLQIVVSFGMRTAMIYFMGVQYLGLGSLFTSILSVLNMAELGVGSAMVFSMYKPIAEEDTDTICALMRLYRLYYRVIGMVILVLGLLCMPIVPHLIKGELPKGLSIYVLYLLNLFATVLSYWLFAYRNCLLSAYQRNDIVNKLGMIISTVQTILQFAAIAVLKNYYAYLIVSLVFQIVSNVATAVITKKMYPRYTPVGTLEKARVQDIHKRIKALFITKFGAIVVNSVDTIVISAYMGLSALAIYQNYYFIMTSVSGFIAIIFNSVRAGVGNSLVTESGEKNYQDFKVLSFIICWILCVCTCCFVGLYQPFMEIWVGKELMLPFGCMLLFCTFFYMFQLLMVWATMKDAAGLWHEDRYRQLIAALFNLTLNLTLVNYIGMYGILLSTVLSYVFISIPWLLRNLFTLLFQRSVKEYLKQLTAYVGVVLVSCTLVSVICTQVILTGGIFGLMLRGVVCVLIPNVLQLVLFRKWYEFGRMLEYGKKMLNRGK